jgi:predicted TPR repeat methyltransferase
MSDTNEPVLDHIGRVRSARAPVEVRDVYESWASTYDDDVRDRYQYVGPETVASTVARYLEPDARLLDAGCGTGLSGVALRERGFSDVHGIDLTPAMLARAADRDIYAALHEMDLSQPLDLPANGFDGVVSAGVFTGPYPLGAAFAEFARVVRPGGYVIVDVRPEHYGTTGFDQIFATLGTEGSWQLVEQSEPKPYIADPGQPADLHVVWVHRVLDS